MAKESVMPSTRSTSSHTLCVLPHPLEVRLSDQFYEIHRLLTHLYGLCCRLHSEDLGHIQVAAESRSSVPIPPCHVDFALQVRQLCALVERWSVLGIWL